MIIKVYITLLPTILAGIFNMIFVKSNLLKNMDTRIDLDKKFIDNKPIFGVNKTYRGAIGMIALSMIFSVIVFGLLELFNISNYSLFYINQDFTIINSLFIGFLLGLAYILFELPNSFIKRRINIEPGKTSSGIVKYIFVFIDQADSVFGCLLVVMFYYNLTMYQYFLYVIIGALTHIVINILLYKFNLRKNMF